MSIIISREGKNAQRIQRTTIETEQYLQKYVYENPECLPLDEIDEELVLTVLAREFSTASGPIDALGVDQEGSIYIIETKLYKNPDKRLVLAQVLDYGASLWRTFEDPSAFLDKLDSAVRKCTPTGTPSSQTCCSNTVAPTEQGTIRQVVGRAF